MSSPSHASLQHVRKQSTPTKKLVDSPPAFVLTGRAKYRILFAHCKRLGEGWVFSSLSLPLSLSLFLLGLSSLSFFPVSTLWRPFFGGFFSRLPPSLFLSICAEFRDVWRELGRRAVSVWARNDDENGTLSAFPVWKRERSFYCSKIGTKR